MRKLIKALISSVILCLGLFSIAGCSPHNINRQNDIKNVIWRSEDNDYGIALEFVVLQDNAHYYGSLAFEYGEKEVAFTWGNGGFDIRPVDYYGQVLEEAEYACGGYDIKNDTCVELEFLSDSLFDGKLNDKKIIIMATEIDGNSYDASVRQEVCWETTDKSFSVYVFQGCRRFGTGTYTHGMKETQFVLYFLEDSQFIAYEIKDGEQTQTILLNGSYYSQGNKLILQSHENNISADGSIKLYSREINNREYPQEIWYPI